MSPLCLQLMFNDSSEDRLRWWLPSGPQQGQACLPEVLVGEVDKRIKTTVQVRHHR